MNGKFGITYKIVFLILVGLVISFVAIGDLTCTFNVRDSKTKNFVADPNISSVPVLNQVAAPGTGGGGPMIYSLSFPRFVTITAKAPGYREKVVKLLLIPRKSEDIFLDEE